MDNLDLMQFWIKSSNADYKTMQVLYKNKQYAWSLFVGHLVIEKLLKALYAKNNATNPYAPKTHDLLYLSRKLKLNLTEEQEKIFDTITKFNINVRYADYKQQFINKCTYEYTSNQIFSIKEIRKWLKKLLIKK